MIVNSNTYLSTLDFEETYYNNYKPEIKTIINNLDKNKNNFHNLVPLKKRIYQFKTNENINTEIKNILIKLNIQEGDFLNIISNSKNFYQIKKIKKRNGKERTLSIPCDKLKLMQRYILENIFYKQIEKINFNPCITGFIQGKSTIDNAIPHLNKKYVIKIDIKDFFPSISRYMIFKAFKKKLNIPHKEAYFFSKIVTCNDSLPQGGITSPFISNICLHNFDNRLTKLINSINKYKTIEASYTRFADDLSFSFNSRINFNRFIEKIYEIIYDEGYIPNYTKTKLLHKTVKQQVTGIIVNGDELSISKKTRDNVRFIINIWKKYGINVAELKYSKIFGKVKESLPLQLQGLISYIKSINEKQGKKLEELFLQVKNNY